MSWSLGETRGLAVKAARGAGMDWGLAEDAGFAVQWLEARGAPGAAALAGLLQWYDLKTGELAPDTAAGRCPVVLGTALSDSRTITKGPLGNIVQPLLLAPFVAVADPDGSWRLTWNNAELKISRDRLQTDAQRDQLLCGSTDCRLETGGTVGTVDAGNMKQRVPDTEQDVISNLNRFAARTYAPATEQSRLAGAGAGLSDND